MKNDNKYFILGVVFLLLALVVYNYSRSKAPSSSPSTGKNSPTTTTEKTASKSSTATVLATTSTKTASPTKPTTVTPKPNPAISASERYLQALDQYKKSGFYIQFYPCQATPGTLTVKKGTKIMLDNRDIKTHAIGANNMKYSIGALNYVIATFNTLGTNYVTCDGGGSAQVNVQQ